MNQSSGSDDVVDLFTVLRLLWQAKWVVATIVLTFAGLGAAYAFLATPVYRATAVLAPNERDEGSPIPSGLSGLASLAGFNLGTSTNSTEALAILRSRAFAAEFIEDFDLLPVLFEEDWNAEKRSWDVRDPEDQPDIRDGVRFFIEQVRLVTEDDETGLVTLSIDWIDPELAADWAGELTARINHRLRARDLKESERKLSDLRKQLDQSSLVELRQAIAQLIQNEIQSMTIARAEEDYAFRVIDPPEVPKERYSPKRALIVALSGALGLVVGAIWILSRAAGEERTSRQDAS
jgi:uncharacterized protein involved in exopolysaccharide biosynthesis